MKDVHYKPYSFRLSEEVKKELERRKPLNKSWNLFFKELLEETK